MLYHYQNWISVCQPDWQVFPQQLRKCVLSHWCILDCYSSSRQQWECPTLFFTPILWQLFPYPLPDLTSDSRSANLCWWAGKNVAVLYSVCQTQIQLSGLLHHKSSSVTECSIVVQTLYKNLAMFLLLIFSCVYRIVGFLRGWKLLRISHFYDVSRKF